MQDQRVLVVARPGALAEVVITRHHDLPIDDDHLVMHAPGIPIQANIDPLPNQALVLPTCITQG